MKTDFKKEVTSYTAPHGRFEVITGTALQYLMIDGHGYPNTSTSLNDALLTLYPVAYTLKFLSKNELVRDYTVMSLEAQRWSSAMNFFTTARDKSQWDWTAMIMTPDWLGAQPFEAAVEVAVEAVQRKGGAPA